MKKLIQMILTQIFICGIMVAPSRAADPIIGNWKLDFRASSSVVGPPLKEHTETYRELTSGEIEFVITRVAKDGTKSTMRFTWPAGGGAAQDPAEALGKGRTVVESLLGSGDWLATFMDHGEQSATIHKVISPDGKTMTQTAKFVDAHGQTLTQIQVFRRQ